MSQHSSNIETLIDNYAVPVPRYTSYPTAPNFHEGVNADDFAGWIAAIDPSASLSLYVHIPFCDTLCWFCGCNTKMTRRYDPVEAYLPSLYSEISQVSETLPCGPKVTHIHWGGGSPTILSASDICDLAAEIRRHFDVARDAEFAVEIDPRGLDIDRVRAMAEAGVTRASIGVQDFDEKVQSAINRRQSYEETRQAVAWLRTQGISAINIDMMYGLPHQDMASISRTADQVVSLEPDRIALFGYAHVPWIKRHQLMIDDDILPGKMQRFEQAQGAAEHLVEAGYCQIGLDHFAKPHDRLAQAQASGVLKRNFQGYTTDKADGLIGLGASSISCLPQGYCQNETAVARYRDALARGGLATAKGVRLGADDVVRRWVIEQLMCDYTFSSSDLTANFGSDIQAVLNDAGDLEGFEQDGMVERTADGFRVTDTGRPFVRAICARFDTYLDRKKIRHSAAV